MRRPEVRRSFGVYRRAVVDENGADAVILVARFLCMRKGPRAAQSRTFSVLPADVIPRRRWSLGWVLKVAMWCSESLVACLDRLNDAGMTVESRQLSRWLEVLGIACERLHQHPVDGAEIWPSGSRRRQAAEFCRVCGVWQASGRGPPDSLVIAWQQQHRSLLLDIKLS